jgi:tRNA threonylcarbamoyladenosine biosynthesis protein TsaB
MSILVMDTVGSQLMLGIISHQKQLTHQHRHDSNNQNHHSATLIPQLKALLSNNHLHPSQLSGIVVNVGPGSFTGIRIALTAAKLMAEWAEIPMIPLTTHQFWAMAIYCDSAEKLQKATYTAVLDARRGRGYIGQVNISTNSGLLPAITTPITCQPVSEMTFDSDLIIASTSIHGSIREQLITQETSSLHPSPTYTSPQILCHWLQQLPCTTNELITQCGQPWHAVKAVYGQQPNITLPKKP